MFTQYNCIDYLGHDKLAKLWFAFLSAILKLL